MIDRYVVLVMVLQWLLSVLSHITHKEYLQNYATWILLTFSFHFLYCIHFETIPISRCECRFHQAGVGVLLFRQ